MSGKALPAHEAGQRGTPVSGEALPAHEAGQRGAPVSERRFLRTRLSLKGGLVSLLSKRRRDE